MFLHHTPLFNSLNRKGSTIVRGLSRPFMFNSYLNAHTKSVTTQKYISKQPHDNVYIDYIDSSGQPTRESLITKLQFTTKYSRKIIDNKIVSVLGYGPQGRAQSLNLKDNNVNVIVGVRKNGDSWKRAKHDGWLPGKNLFDIDEATFRGNIVKYLLSDTAQIKQWGNVKHNLNTGDTLYFSHGFGIHYYNYTNINPPEDINVIMVSPKCSGNTVRKHFKNNTGFASSYAIYKNYDNAENICKALAFLIGNNYIFKTTFENEVNSDLTGERCVLMGLIQGAFMAQYKTLRENGHSPLEAYHETVEEALQSLYPLINEKGMDWMYKNCSATAQRGVLDWGPRFEKTLKPVIEECYKSVKDNTEVERVIEYSQNPDYNVNLKGELDKISQNELWEVGRQLRHVKKKFKKYSDTNDNIYWNGIYFEQKTY